MEESLLEPDEIIHDRKNDILMFIILEEYKKTCRNSSLRTDAYIESLRTVPRLSDSSFVAVFAAMCVACRADKPRDIIRTKLAQMERKSETSFSYQFERSTFGDGLFRLQSKIGLSINGTGNLIFDRKIRFEIG